MLWFITSAESHLRVECLAQAIEGRNTLASRTGTRQFVLANSLILKALQESLVCVRSDSAANRAIAASGTVPVELCALPCLRPYTKRTGPHGRGSGLHRVTGGEGRGELMKSYQVLDMSEKLLPFVLLVLYCPNADWNVFTMASEARAVDLVGPKAERC